MNWGRLANRGKFHMAAGRRVGGKGRAVVGYPIGYFNKYTVVGWVVTAGIGEEGWRLLI